VVLAIPVFVVSVAAVLAVAVVVAVPVIAAAEFYALGFH